MVATNVPRGAVVEGSEDVVMYPTKTAAKTAAISVKMAILKMSFAPTKGSECFQPLI